MQYISEYQSPMGRMTIASDETGISGLWFDGQKYDRAGLVHPEQKETEFIHSAKQWLDQYFSGKKPDFTPALHLSGTEFQILVWKKLLKIPYGTTVTYGELAEQVAEETGRESMSSQAVGGAVGHNHISIIVPCHRVVGAHGELTGYAGGIERKQKLLKLEEILK